MSQTSHRVIAIDGPAASGKSSVARELAERLGFAYVNSGAMYRAATWFVLNHNVAAATPDEIARSLEHATIVCDLVDRRSRIRINGVDPEPFLCEDQVNHEVSRISSIAHVRELLVRQMRAYADANDVVIEGRDIGSVVFPETPFKFYIDASPEVRERRRQAQGQRDEIAARDRADSSRRTAPLVISEDAYVIDSSNLTIDGVVGEIIGRLKLKGLDVAAATR